MIIFFPRSPPLLVFGSSVTILLKQLILQSIAQIIIQIKQCIAPPDFSLLIQHCFKYSLAFSLFHIIVMIIINFVFIIIGISLLHYFNQLHYFWSQCQTRCAACRCNDIVTEKINIAVFCISVQTDCYISKSVHKDISNEMDNTSL